MLGFRTKSLGFEDPQDGLEVRNPYAAVGQETHCSGVFTHNNELMSDASSIAIPRPSSCVSQRDRRIPFSDGEE